MKDDEAKQCGWDQCIDDCVKHVHFGVHVFVDIDPREISLAPDKTEHIDLCQRHVEFAQLQYLHVSIYDLNACPNKKK